MYDRGIRLKIKQAPESYTVSLANGQILEVEDDIVKIPDELFTQFKDIELYIEVKSGEAVNTLCKIIIPVIWRPARGSVSTENVSNSG